MEEIKGMLKSLLEGQKVTHARLDSMENRLDSVENRLDSVENRLNSMEKRFDRVENKVDGVQGQLNEVSESVNHLVFKTALNEKEIHLLKKYREWEMNKDQ
ncbi:hypothetical protein [Paludifilum halophilum]|uniref:Uncharacterized protein n=1 Tax=Paludifilum halophilum TaxID=1642702 RepID=A0A235B1J2_9BACL|nr:hypothetical protein [Paludifilum halophilum]OYD06176.1 hypothetical protein CHM34_17670 [Paludifilum halophilum]